MKIIRKIGKNNFIIVCGKLKNPYLCIELMMRFSHIQLIGY